MKISQKQALLLAKEIFKKLKEKKVQRISPELKARLSDYVEKRNILKKKEMEARDEVIKHEDSLFKIVGKLSDRVYGNDTLTQIIEKVEKKMLPSIQEIEDEIILKSMFANEDDMQKFMDSVIAKYEKTLQSKVVVN